MVVVLAHVHQILICADTTKETGGREKKPSALLLPVHLLRLQLFSKAIYGQLLLPLPASLYVPSEWQSEEGKIWMSTDARNRT